MAPKIFKFGLWHHMVVLLIVGVLLPAGSMAQKLDHAKMTAKVWDFLKTEQYDSVVVYADQCVQEYWDVALVQQQSVKEPLPIGKVDAAVKERIMKNGPLNDLATCLVIKGRAFEQSGDVDRALLVYETLAQFSHARCYQAEADIFWSPSMAASDRIGVLKENTPKKK